MKHVLGILAVVAAHGALAQGFGGPEGLTTMHGPPLGESERFGGPLSGKMPYLDPGYPRQPPEYQNGDVHGFKPFFGPEVTTEDTFQGRYAADLTEPAFDTKKFDFIQNKEDFVRLLARSPGATPKSTGNGLTEYQEFLLRAASMLRDGPGVIGGSVRVDPDYELGTDKFGTSPDGYLTLEAPFIVNGLRMQFTHNGEYPGRIRVRLEETQDGNENAISQIIADPGWDRMYLGNDVGGISFRIVPDGIALPEIRYSEIQTADGRRGIITCDGGEKDAPCFPEVVSLNIRSSLMCTGTLIGAKHILTAAHCFCNGTPTKATTGTRAPNGSDRQPAGTHSVSIRDDPIYLKNDFDGRSFCEMRADGAQIQDPAAALAIEAAIMPYDLALIPLRERPMLSVLTTSLVVTYPAPTARIAARNLYDEASHFVLAGYGRGNNSPAGKLQFIDVPKGATPCAGADEFASTSCDPDREFSLIDDKQDTCKGDSGSAVMASLDDSPGNLIFGVTSRGFVSDCGPGGVYVRTHHDDVLDWLMTQVPDLTVVTASEALHASFLR